MALLQAADIAGFVVRRAILPAAEQNADPLEGECPDCGMVALAFVSLELVEGARPSGFASRAGGELLKGLP